MPRIPVEVDAEPWVPGFDAGVEWEIAVTDTTLRDGMQGWRSLGIDEAVGLYMLLSEIGPVVESTELFLYTEEQRRIYREVERHSGPRPIGWIRASLSDVRLVTSMGVGETVVLASVGPLHVERKMGSSWAAVRDRYLEAVEALARAGVSFRLALEDVTRAPWRIVEDIVSRARAIADRHNVGFRVKLSDTLGLGLPFPQAPLPRGIPALVGRLRGLGLEPGEIEFHGHNDLGLVVANQLAAWLSGASYGNCTLLGVGERAGNCPMEVVLVHYMSLTGRVDRVNLRVLPEIVDYFRRLGYRVPEHQPIIGENAFNTKAGIHVDGLLKDPRLYLPFHPGIVGRRATVSIDKLSGRSGVYLLLRHLGVPVKGKNDPLVEKGYRLLLEGVPPERLPVELGVAGLAR